MKTIPLTKGLVTLVDDADFEFLNQWKWHAMHAGNNGKFYAVRRDTKPPRRYLYMHRVILDAPESVEVDHWDRDGLNNQRGNLRPSTHQQNLCNRAKDQDNRSGFKGVTRLNDCNRWAAHCSGTYVGLFPTAELAAQAYDRAATQRFGEFARTNAMMGLIK